MVYPSSTKLSSSLAYVERLNERTDLQISHTKLDPVSIRKVARETAANAIEVQKSEMRALGVMADWDKEDGVYKTMGTCAHPKMGSTSTTLLIIPDNAYEIRQLRLFGQMVKEGEFLHGNFFAEGRRIHYASAPTDVLLAFVAHCARRGRTFLQRSTSVSLGLCRFTSQRSIGSSEAGRRERASRRHQAGYLDDYCLESSWQCRRHDQRGHGVLPGPIRR